MSFIYSKTLSVEELFAKFDTNHDGKIDKNEKKFAKEQNLFPDFNIKSGMTLDKFEKKNLEVYKKYELANTSAYSKQQSMIDEAFKRLNEFENEELDEIEKELKIEQAELELRRSGFDLAMEMGVVLTKEQLNLPINEFMNLINSIIKQNENNKLFKLD